MKAPWKRKIWSKLWSLLVTNYVKIGLAFFFLSAFGLVAASLLTNRDAPRIFAVDSASINRSVEPEELALWYIQGKRDFEVLDLRSKDEYEAGHIQNAISCPVCHQNKKDAYAKIEAGQEMPNFQKKIVVYTATDKEPVYLPRILATKSELYRLKGGYEAWQDRVIKTPVFSAEDSPQQIEQKKRAAAISNFFTGKHALSAPVIKPKKMPKHKHIISSGPNEGC